MAFDLRLQQKMVQQLVMTPQLQQAIKLLQLSHLEMAEVLREELEQNPILEERGEGPEETAPSEGPHEVPDSPTIDEAMTMDTSAHESHEGGDAHESSPDMGGESFGDSEQSGEGGSMLDLPVDQTPEPTTGEV